MIRKLTKTENPITGNLSGITGDLSECDITEDDRKRGINISELVQI